MCAEVRFLEAKDQQKKKVESQEVWDEADKHLRRLEKEMSSELKGGLI